MQLVPVGGNSISITHSKYEITYNKIAKLFLIRPLEDQALKVFSKQQLLRFGMPKQLYISITPDAGDFYENLANWSVNPWGELN